MRNIVKIWLCISLVLLVGIGYALLNTYVSIKYEVDDAKVTGLTDEHLREKGRLLNELAFLLKVGGGYVLANVVLVGRWLVDRPDT
ncbi:hypothetical protein [Dyadobacter fermentans]|uniref:hypothetical protein n=1 Tax=Dyadobacter fermentans TaxID=94254 RepID=UPI001CBF71F1|nr:hypothetical protein [Dyadobacter fermentans]MBZ1361685.1 hypothetical protein [Dyadobacter fermentans]